MYPTIGRIVHYWSKRPDGMADDGPQPCAAIITGVFGVPDKHSHKHPCTEVCAQVSLAVFRVNGVTMEPYVYFFAEPRIGHWSWPPKV